jgi:hypothetical protein
MKCSDWVGGDTRYAIKQERLNRFLFAGIRFFWANLFLCKDACVEKFLDSRKMKERLEDLISEADKMLLERENAAHAQDLSAPSLNEVDRDTSAHFNQAPLEPKQVFWKRYPRAAGLVTFVLLLMIAVRVYMVATMPRAIGHYHVVTGIVQRSDVSSRRQGYGLRAVTARLLLPNGNIVTMQVDSQVTLPEGTAVPVRLYDTGAVQLEPGIRAAESGP